MAGMVSLARFATTTIGGHSTDNLAAIAAVVLGGTSLFGGIGTVLGTVVGVFIPAILQNGFVILGVQPFWQQVAVGAVLIVAVYIDQLKRRAQERGEKVAPCADVCSSDWSRSRSRWRRAAATTKAAPGAAPAAAPSSSSTA